MVFSDFIASSPPRRRRQAARARPDDAVRLPVLAIAIRVKNLSPVNKLSGKPSFIVTPVDGLTLYSSHACDKLCFRTIVLLSCDISPLCDVAQTSDCGMHCLYFLL